MNRLTTALSISILTIGLSTFACNDNNNDAPSAQFEVTIENTGQAYSILKSDAFTTPVGAAEPSPLMPGEAYEFEFTAPAGASLSLATMFAQSNDWIFATDEDGIELYNEDGSKVIGDVTSQIDLYDAGTEEDQEVGIGDNQAPRQSGPNTGPADDNPNVRLVDEAGLPANEDMIMVTLTSTDMYGFKVRIENVSDDNTLQTPDGNKPALLSPGVWLVHSSNESGLLYTLGEPSYGDGLEAIAEDGNPGVLAPNLAEATGLITLLSPGAYAVYKGMNPIFQANAMPPDNGIEHIAEDGNPEMLGTVLESEENVSESGVFNQPDGASSPGVLMPGNTYSFTFTAEEGDLLTFATMYAQSNDLFFSSMEEGINLFSDGSPISAKVTGEILLWDAATEANEEPGVGSNQAPRQGGPNTGPADDNPNVRPVSDGYNYGEVSSHIKVTITATPN